MPKTLHQTSRNLPAGDAACPDDLDAAIQETVTKLADVDHAYAQRRMVVNELSGPDAVKQRLRAGLESMHRRDREALVKRLADLRYQVMRLTMFRTLH